MDIWLSPTSARSTDRRKWLRRALAWGGAAALARLSAQTGAASQAHAGEQPQSQSTPDALQEGLIDSHSHVWTSDVQKFPLAKGFAKAEMRPPSFTPQELMAHARPCGVSRVVLIQMSYYGFDNSYMLAAIREQPGVFSGVAVIDEHAAGVRETMQALRRQGVRGFRIHPALRPVERWLFDDAMAKMWKIAADEQLAMCALVNPEALPALDRMCEKFPQTTLVIDHFARIGMDGTVRDADVENLCRLARHSKSLVKVSAYYALGKRRAPYTDLGPMMQKLLNAYGRERLMWGSDCPYQVGDGHRYCDSVDLIRNRVAFLSPDDRRWLLSETARTTFFN